MAHPLVQFDSGRDGFRDLIANFLAKAHRMRSRSMEYGAGRIAKRIVESTELTHTIAIGLSAEKPRCCIQIGFADAQVAEPWLRPVESLKPYETGS